MSRCIATTRAGKPCPFSARPGSDRCTAHLAAAGDPAARAEQRERRRPSKRARDLFARYHDDPVSFAVDVLGVHPWSRQADFLQAVAAHERVALKAGQKVSKSNSLAILMLWFACTRPGGRVFFTNSSERQVSMVNYRELTRLYRAAKVPLGAKVYDTAGRGIVWPDDREIIGFATDEVDRLGGLSGENLLFIVDEASGVPTSLFEGIEGNTAADNAKFIVCGNPLRPSDYFYDTFHSKSSSWHCMTISSLESPNVVEGREVIRGLASPKFVKRIADNYGVGSPFWNARVIGEFPDQSESSVIALADVLAAAQRGVAHALLTLTPEQTRALGPLSIGVDAGRTGDASPICSRRGSVVVGLAVYHNQDGPGLAARVVEEAIKHRVGDERVVVKIDVIGIGASPYDALVHNGPPWLDAIPVNVAESPTVEDNYARLRDQLWFQLGSWLKHGGAIPNDERLIAELTAPTYTFELSGKRKVEGKDSLRKRLKRSPDRADALALAIFDTIHQRSMLDAYAAEYGDAVAEPAYERPWWA